MKCPICKEAYDEDLRKTTRLSCGHHICQNCRDKATNRRWKCCYCKNLVNFDDPGKALKNGVKAKKGGDKKVVDDTDFRRIDELECLDCYQNFFEQDMKYCKGCSGDVKMSICEKCAGKNHQNHAVADIFPSVKFERERMVREFLSPYGIKVLKCFNDMISASENPSSFDEYKLKDIIEDFKAFMKSAGIVEKPYVDMIKDYEKGKLNKKQKRVVDFLYGKIECFKCGTLENDGRAMMCKTCRKINLCSKCKNFHRSKRHEVVRPEIFSLNLKEDPTRSDLGIFYPAIFRPLRYRRAPEYKHFLDNEWRLDRMAQIARIGMIHAASREHTELFKTCFYSTVATCHECQIVHRKQDMNVCEKCIDFQLQSDPSTLLTYDLSKMALCQQCSNKSHNNSGHRTHEFMAVEVHQNITDFHDKNGYKDKEVRSFQDIAMPVSKMQGILEIDRNFAIAECWKLEDSAKCSICDNKDRRGSLQLCENCVNKRLSKTPECLMTLNLDDYALCKKCVFKSHSGHRMHNYEFVAGCKMAATHMSDKLKKMKTVPLRKFTDITDYPEEIQETPEFMELMMEMIAKMRNM